MAKKCPLTQQSVLYLDCIDCDDKMHCSFDIKPKTKDNDTQEKDTEPQRKDDDRCLT